MPTSSPSPASLADYFSTAANLNGQPAMEPHHKYFLDSFEQIVVQRPNSYREAAAFLVFTAMRMEDRLTDDEIYGLKGVLSFLIEKGEIDLEADPFDKFFPGGLTYPSQSNG